MKLNRKIVLQPEPRMAQLIYEQGILIAETFSREQNIERMRRELRERFPERMCLNVPQFTVTS